ncbi:hypothetical protein MJD09_01590 [bacterium]|nr:hypothetical protein [bacterium]
MKLLRSFIPIGCLSVVFWQVSAQTKLVSFDSPTKRSEILEFNRITESLGFTKGQFLTTDNTVIASNGVEIPLTALQEVKLLTPRHVVIMEKNQRSHLATYMAHIYDDQAELLFTIQRGGIFRIYPTGTGHFLLNHPERWAGKEILVLDSNGNQVQAHREARKLNHWLSIDVSPDRSFFIVNVTTGGSPDENALLAIGENGEELWRKPRLGSSEQLAISNNKVAIGSREGEVRVFDKLGNLLEKYTVGRPYDATVALSADGKYLAVASPSRIKRETPVKSTSLYLIDLEKDQVVEPWPIEIQDSTRPRLTPVYLKVEENMLLVVFGFDVWNIRLYDFSGRSRFETTMPITGLDKNQIPYVYLDQGRLQILSAARARFLILSKTTRPVR